MKTKTVIYFILTCFCLAGVLTTQSCGCGGCPPDKNTNDSTSIEPGHLNVSIFLDLSNRIIEDQQVERDSAIVAHIAKVFKDSTLAPNPGVQESHNSIKVIFHPDPTDQSIQASSKKLSLDVQSVSYGKDRLHAVKRIDQIFGDNIGLIHKKALSMGQWPGSDIWGFFTNGKLKQQCIKKGYRNILILITDGEILYLPTKVQKGDSSNYISTQILTNPKAELMVGVKGLEGLEVLVLELRPRDPNQLPKMKSMIENWLAGMGVKKFTICETDRSELIEPIIDEFFKH